MPKHRILPQGLALISGLLLSLSAIAAPITLNVTGVSLSQGSGYGNENSSTEGGPGATLLKVAFNTSVFVTQLFALDLSAPPGTSTHSFTFGTIVLQEPDTNGGILAAETDSLHVTADLIFSDPIIGTRSLVGTGTATPGLVSDADVDYTLSWAPIIVSFGAGGQFRISLDDLAWTGTGAAGAKNLTARLTLLNEPSEPVLNSVPEPSTALLLGSAFGAIAWRRRARQNGR